MPVVADDSPRGAEGQGVHEVIVSLLKAFGIAQVLSISIAIVGLCYFFLFPLPFFIFFPKPTEAEKRQTQP